MADPRIGLGSGCRQEFKKPAPPFGTNEAYQASLQGMGLRDWHRARATSKKGHFAITVGLYVECGGIRPWTDKPTPC
jgi:hypothetical protein